MRAEWKIAVLAVLAAAVAGVCVVRFREAPERAPARPASQPSSLPQLLEFGADKCKMCKEMKPILDQLAADFAGQLHVQSVHIYEQGELAEKHKVNIIPTQIFLDAQGKELFRHNGFMSREDILAKWKELGVELAPPASATVGTSHLRQLLTDLTHAVEGTPAVALAASLLWGVLSILLSPCHLASIPLIVGFIGAQGRTSTRRAFAVSSLFAMGILITIAAIGAVTAAAGQLLGDLGPWGTAAVAVVFFAVGLHLLGVIPMPFSGPGQVGTKRRGLLAAFVLGLVFGVALGPCTFAFMAPVLAVTLKVAASQWIYGAALLAAYGLGHCSVIVVAGTSAELVQRYLNWNEKSRGSVILRGVCGAAVLLGGLYLLYIA